MSSHSFVKHLKRKYLGYDLQVLEKLREPTTVYDLIKIGLSASSAHNLLQKYLNQGIIKHVKTVKVPFGLGYKKYYALTELGSNLLSLLEKINNNSLNKQKIFR